MANCESEKYKKNKFSEIAMAYFHKQATVFNDFQKIYLKNSSNKS